MKRALAIGAFAGLTAFAFAGTSLAGKKSDVKIYIAGAEVDGLADPDLADSARDLTGKLDDFVIVSSADEADVVVIVVSRGKYVGDKTVVSSSYGGGYGSTTAGKSTLVALAVKVSLRDGRTVDIDYAFDDTTGLVSWRGVAGKLSGKIRKFIEANEAAIKGSLR